MRNIAGFKFPHQASDSESKAVCDLSSRSIANNLGLTVLRGLGRSERDGFVASRLISHDFQSESLGRALCLDDELSTSIMINEEDHIRIQSILPGWNIDAASRQAKLELELLKDLNFAWSAKFGYLSASPFNCGDGVRLSAMFHLIALSTTKRLPRVLRALDALKVIGRGLYGESSKAIGAFVQVSVARDDISAIRAAGAVVMQEERRERESLGVEQLREKAIDAFQFAIAARTIGLADGLRVLGWARWAASERLLEATTPQTVDALLAQFEPRFSDDSPDSARNRAVRLRDFLEPFWGKLLS
jgi:protein arginine kinase